MIASDDLLRYLWDLAGAADPHSAYLFAVQGNFFSSGIYVYVRKEKRGISE